MASEEEVVIPSLLLSNFECNPDDDIGYMDWIGEAIAKQELGWLENTDPT